MHPQLGSSHSYIYIAYSSSAPCGAVRCSTLPCGAVLFHAALYLLSSILSYPVYDAKCQVPDRYWYVRVFVLVFKLFWKLIFPSRYLCFFSRPKLHPHCRSECAITNKHTAVHRTGQLLIGEQAALGIIDSLIAPKHGPLLFLPPLCTCFSCILTCASDAARGGEHLYLHRGGRPDNLFFDISHKKNGQNGKLTGAL